MNWMALAGISLLVLVAGCVQNQAVAPDSVMMEKEKEAAMEKTEQDSMMDKTGESMTEETGLSGVYVPFSKNAYDQARAEGKVVYLEFYANWCPICKAQAPVIESAFLDDYVKGNEKLVGFRVNYNDSETDESERNLAREFGVTYQHTHVILKSDGSVSVKSLETNSKEEIVQELKNAGA